MATHSSVLAWRIPRTAEPGGLPSMGSHRVRHNWSDLAAAVELNRDTIGSLYNSELSPCVYMDRTHIQILSVYTYIGARTEGMCIVYTCWRATSRYHFPPPEVMGFGSGNHSNTKTGREIIYNEEVTSVFCSPILNLFLVIQVKHLPSWQPTVSALKTAQYINHHHRSLQVRVLCLIPTLTVNSDNYIYFVSDANVLPLASVTLKSYCSHWL